MKLNQAYRNMQNSKTIWSKLFQKEKAQSIHKDLKSKMPNPAAVAALTTRSGCFGDFKHHYNF